MDGFRAAASLALWFLLAGAVHATPGAGLPTTTYPAGTLLSTFNHGGRITTFHRGKLYLGGTTNQSTWTYDIADPRNPRLLCTGPGLGNSHVWYKVGDLFFRQDLDRWSAPPRLLDFTGDMCNPPAWRQAIHDFPLASQIAGDDWLPTYPYAFTANVLDARVGWWPVVASRDLMREAGNNATNRFRIGNLLFITPGDGQQGVSVFDIGNPANPRLLDVLSGNYLQYTTAWHVWKHYLVMMIGHDGNGPAAGANALVIDFSDPADLKIAWTVPRADLPGRYVHFQDDNAFSGHVAQGRGGGDGVKYSMTERRVLRRFEPPNTGTDFQWIPLGHLLLVSGSEVNGSASALYSHQDGLDRTPPSIAYHLPRNGALNQPLATAIGLVVHEQLDSTTVNEESIQLRIRGGAAVPSIVMHTSYDVINVVPVRPLQADTVYEVHVVGGRLRDVAGNAMPETRFTFSTGNLIGEPPNIASARVTTPAPRRVAQSLAFDAQSSGSPEYSWSFGDGSPASPWSTASTISHTFSRPGIYNVAVQARNASGIDSETLRVVVETVPAAVPPAASASVLISGSDAWAVNPDHGSVARFDAATLARTGLFDVCGRPVAIAADGAGRIWTACRDDDRLVAIDRDGRAVKQLATGPGSEPSAIVFDATGTTGFATLAGDRSVMRFDPAQAVATASVDLGFAAQAVARVGTRLYVARHVSADDGGRVAVIETQGAFQAVAGSAGHPGVALPIDTQSSDSSTAGRGVPNYVSALVASPDLSRIWYAAKKDNILRGLARDGAELEFDKQVRTIVGAIDVGAAEEVAQERMDIDNSALADALVLADGGAVLFAALAGNDRVVAVDPWHRAELARFETGATPRGLALDRARGRLWVRNELGRSVSVFDVRDLLAGIGGPPALLATVPSVASEVLPAEVLAGKRLFWRADARMSADGYLACASCHLDGGSDGRVWDFTQRGEGLRRTLSLRGRAGMAHGPLHWTANFDELQDFEHDIREAFGGTGLMSDALYHRDGRDTPLGTAKAGVSPDLDALARYVATLDSVGSSPRRNSDGTLSAEAHAGRLVFQRAGCADCHGGTGFTDSASLRWHDVGTVGPDDLRAGERLLGFDTPTLRGLWHERAYLHDGSETGVLEAITRTGLRHGDIGALGADERAQLEAYLLSIDDHEPAVSEPFELSMTSPAPNATVDPAGPMAVEVVTDLDGVQRIEVLLDGSVAATLLAPPWRAQIPVQAGTRPAVRLRLVHANGASTWTAPVTVRVSAVPGALLRDGFEAP